MRLPLPPSCTPPHTAPHPKYNTLPQWYKQDPSSYPSPSWQSSRPGSYQAAYSPPPGPVHESHLCWAPQTPLSPPQTNGVLSEPLGLHTRLDLFPGLMSLPEGGRGGRQGVGGMGEQAVHATVSLEVQPPKLGLVGLGSTAHSLGHPRVDQPQTPPRCLPPAVQAGASGPRSKFLLCAPWRTSPNLRQIICKMGLTRPTLPVLLGL